MEAQLDYKFKSFEIYYYYYKSSYDNDSDTEALIEAISDYATEELYYVMPEWFELIGINTIIKNEEKFNFSEISLTSAVTNKFKSTKEDRLKIKEILDWDSLWGQKVIRIPLVKNILEDCDLSSYYL